MRSLVVTPGMTGADGIAAVSRLIVSALGPAGDRPGSAEVDVLSMTDPPGLRRCGPPGLSPPAVRLFGAGGGKRGLIAAGLRVAAGRPRYEHVVCLHVRLGAMARLVAGRRARLVIFLHGIEAWRRLSRVERMTLSRAELLMANSEHTARRFREANPDCSGRFIRVCHPGVAMDGEAVAEPPPGGAPDGARSDSFALIVGRMAARERYKGHDLLIDIWPRVIGELPGARLVVVGEGDDRARLEGRAAGLGEHITFLGQLSDAALARIYEACAFFVMPSRDEGFGLVFLEAMRAGKGCIGGIGAAAEVIEDGVTGLVVNPRDPEDVLKAILQLFREPETRGRMGRAGAVRVAKQFTEAHFRQRFRALLGVGSAST